jgi:hypothetical protein
MSSTVLFCLPIGECPPQPLFLFRKGFLEAQSKGLLESAKARTAGVCRISTQGNRMKLGGSLEDYSQA